MNKEYKIGDNDKVELFQVFFQALCDFGYIPQFIGKELAYIARALERAVDED